ncbi:MAG: DUF6159 family protein [Bryobacteraceae bacterium]
MSKLDRTWLLFKESFAVLAADGEILLFPVLSGISILLLSIGFFVPMYENGMLKALALRRGTWEHYAVLFAWYYLNFFVGIFFNGALIGCANIRLSGGNPTVSDGFRIAFSRVGRIAGWAFIAATVGMVLHGLRERGKGILNLLVAGLSLMWTLITYMVVPVLLFEDCGVVGSIHRSEELFEKHWGEQVAGDFGFGLLSFFLSLPAFAIAFFVWKVDRVAAIIFPAVYLLILATVTSAVKGVFTVALYRYATQGSAPVGFSADAINDLLGGRKPLSLGESPWDRNAPWDQQS